jgi:hypothetical protein
VPEPPARRSSAGPAATAIAAVAAIPLLFAIQLWTVAFMAQHQITSCVQHIPFQVVSDADETSGGEAQLWPSFALLAIAAMQTGLLLLIDRNWGRTPQPLLTIAVPVACAVLLVEALLAPAMTSPDAYSYVAYAKLGMASSYVPHFQPLSPRQDFFTWCLKVYFPAAYGPGFVAYVGAILAQSTSLESSILILRATNAAWLIALVALVRLSGAPPRTVALLALNSAFLFQYVTNAHNDILPVVLVVAAILAARRSVLSGALLVIAAALFKIPFAAIGSLAFVRLTPPFRRFGIAALTVVVSFGLSYAIGGPNYFATLAFHSRIMAAGADRLEFVLAIAALLAIAFALVRQRFHWALSFTMPALAVEILQPWYVAWSLPYALVESEHLSTFLVLAPFATLLMEDGISRASLLSGYAISCAIIAGGIFRDVRFARSRPGARSTK